MRKKLQENKFHSETDWTFFFRVSETRFYNNQEKKKKKKPEEEKRNFIVKLSEKYLFQKFFSETD